MPHRKPTDEQLRKMMRFDDPRWQAHQQQLTEDLASFKGPLDGLSDDARAAALATMLAKDAHALRIIRQVSRMTLRGMYGPC